MATTGDRCLKMATTNHHLPQPFPSSSFAMYSEIFLQESNIPTTTSTISLRSTAMKDSQEFEGHGEGFVVCNFLNKCDTKKCACIKNVILCNSKWHIAGFCFNRSILIHGGEALLSLGGTSCVNVLSTIRRICKYYC